MAKTPAQLDREIARSLRKWDAPAMRGDHYYVADRGGHRTIYGPYETQREAELAGYFHKPVTDRDATPAHIFFMRGVQEYTGDEIEALTHSPEEWGFKSVKLSRRAPTMHASWRAFDAEFRQYLRERAEQLAGRRS